MGNSRECTQGCGDSSWSHDKSTLHRSQTSGVAERGGRWVKEKFKIHGQADELRVNKSFNAPVDGPIWSDTSLHTYLSEGQEVAFTRLATQCWRPFSQGYAAHLGSGWTGDLFIAAEENLRRTSRQRNKRFKIPRSTGPHKQLEIHVPMCRRIE